MRAPDVRVAVLVVGGVGGAVIGILASNVSHPLAWSIQFTALGMLLGGVMELYITRAQPSGSDYELIRGERALKKAYAQLRRTRNATLVKAIWSANYANVKKYFAGERRDLVRNPDLRVTRRVDRDIFRDSSINEALKALVARSHKQIEVLETRCPEFEFFLCQSDDGGTIHLRALFIVNNASNPRTPEVGIYIDSSHSGQGEIARTLQHWFEGLPRLSQIKLDDDSPPDSAGTRLRLFAVRLSMRLLRDPLATLLYRGTHTRARTPLLVVGAVMLAIGGLVISRASDVALWSIQIAIVGFILYVVAKMVLIVDTSSASLALISGERDLRIKYEEMRRTDGVREIGAVWSAQYLEVESYFEREKRELSDSPAVKIERLVDPGVLQDPNLKRALEDLTVEYANLKAHETDSPEFECFLCRYEREGAHHLKALFVINDVFSQSPGVGIYVDSQTDPAVRSVANAISQWFRRLPRRRLMSAEGNIWDYNARNYDRDVTNSGYRFLRTFLDTEHELLRSHVLRLSGEGNRVSIIEVGVGTGRTLIQLAREIPADRVPYLIGIDNSSEMIDISRAKAIGKHGAASEERLGFLTIDALRIESYFTLGDVHLDRLREHFPGSTFVASMDRETYRTSRKVICSLLNTLGVMEDGVRLDVLRGMVNAVEPGDLIALAVFAGEIFQTEAPALYRRLPDIVGGGDIPDSAFDDGQATFRYTNPQGKDYLSHWFREEEMRALLEDQNCDVIGIEDIGDYGYMVIASPREP